MYADMLIKCFPTNLSKSDEISPWFERERPSAIIPPLTMLLSDITDIPFVSHVPTIVVKIPKKCQEPTNKWNVNEC